MRLKALLVFLLPCVIIFGSHAQNNPIDTYILSADTCMAAENYIHAMDYLTKAATILEEVDSTDSRLAEIYMKLATCFDYFDYTDFSTGYLQRALALFIRSGNEAKQAYCLSYLGDMYEDHGNNTTGLRYQRMALQKFIRAEDKKGMAIVYDNLSSIYENYKEYDTSISCLEKAYELYSQIHDSVGQCVVLNNFGDIWLKKKNPQTALSCYMRSLSLSRQIHNKEEERGNLKDLSRCYAEMGRYQEAYQLFDQFFVLHRKLKIEKKIEEISSLQVQSIQEKKELEIKTIQSEKKVSSLRFIVLIISLSLGIIILLSIYISYRSYVRKDKQLQQLKENGLRAELEARKEKLFDYARQISERGEMIEALKTQLTETLENNEVKESLRYKAIEQLSNAVILTDEDWTRFKKQFESVYEGFFIKLRTTYPDLSTGDIRLAALLKLNLTQEEIARMMGISVDGVKKAKGRLKKKIAVDEDFTFKNWIEAIS